MSLKSFYALIVGAGPGTGRAAAIRFSKAYPVVLLARRAESYEDTVAEIRKAGGQAIGITADMTDPAVIDSTFDTIAKELPDSKLAAAIYNVNSGFLIKPFLETKPEEFQTALSGQAGGFFTFAQKTLPLLLEAVPDSPNPPSLIITGATASLKASAKFASFAAGKFALRALSQSLAREFGPQGVHVTHAIIDGFIDTPGTKGFPMKNNVEDAKIKPEAIAESYWHLHTQHRSCFTQELDLRPYSESF
ncbi:short-chain dehydrogenase [Dactylonectria macrodidyma]|uniref:Short-chain dehydrogenase n=1 Tax=Dactylonectria macrodidyma TaxID=307937 RepID=A0A9P9JKE9_9HYPO|nr:short-chain dehydrogenase [Dactylonectria macrodidyma]